VARGSHEIGREATPDELAEALGMPLKRVRRVLEFAGNCCFLGI